MYTTLTSFGQIDKQKLFLTKNDVTQDDFVINGVI